MRRSGIGTELPALSLRGCPVCGSWAVGCDLEVFGVMKHAEIKTMDDWLQWRDEQRSRHRHMTLGEYMAWTRGGDNISHPSSSNAFVGSLTIDLYTPPIIGRFIDDDGNVTR